MLRQVVPAGADRALVLALSPTCHFCNDSMPFYKQLLDQRNQKGSAVKVIAGRTALRARFGPVDVNLLGFRVTMAEVTVDGRLRTYATSGCARSPRSTSRSES